MLQVKSIIFKMKISIENGKIFSQGKFIYSNILIENNIIAKITSDNLQADTVIDASNKIVIPGLIDMHVHFRDFGQELKGTWESESKAAICGGVTTVFEMPNNKIPINNVERYNNKLLQVAKKSSCNFGLYFAVTQDNVEELNNSNIKLAKLYYGETTGKINPGKNEEIFKKLNKDIFLIVHAEDNSIISENKNHYSKDLKNYHSLIRNNKAEYTAVNDIIDLSRKYDRQIHITHISSEESMKLIKDAKSEGLKVTCDTCFHYIFLDDSIYEKYGEMANANPGIKSKKDMNSLWQYINDGTVDCLCSDHAPHTFEEKKYGMSGLASVEISLFLLLAAAKEGKIKLEKAIQLMSSDPANLLNQKNKGTIKEGYDADIVIIDLEIQNVIQSSRMISKSKWTPFEGKKSIGKIEYVIIDGKIILNNKNNNLEFNNKLLGKNLLYKTIGE